MLYSSIGKMIKIDYTQFVRSLCGPGQLPFYIAYALEQMENILAHFVFILLTSYGFAYGLLSLSPPLRGFNSGSGRNQTIMDIQVFSHSITSYLPSVFLPNQTRLFVIWIGVFAAIALLLICLKKDQPRLSENRL